MDWETLEAAGHVAVVLRSDKYERYEQDRLLAEHMLNFVRRLRDKAAAIVETERRASWTPERLHADSARFWEEMIKSSAPVTQCRTCGRPFKEHESAEVWFYWSDMDTHGKWCPARVLPFAGALTDDDGRLSILVDFKRPQFVWAEPQYVRHLAKHCRDKWLNPLGQYGRTPRKKVSGNGVPKSVSENRTLYQWVQLSPIVRIWNYILSQLTGGGKLEMAPGKSPTEVTMSLQWLSVNCLMCCCGA